MAIQARAVKGGISIAAAYIMVLGLQMQKYGRPDVDETGEPITVPAVQYTARVQLYESEAARLASFGMAEATFAFTFEHTSGADPVAEAYGAIKMNSLEGWALYEVEDV